MANNIEVITVEPFACRVSGRYLYPEQKLPSKEHNAALMAEMWFKSFKSLGINISDGKLKDIWNNVTLYEVLPYAMVCAMQGDLVFARIMQVRDIFMDKFLRDMGIKQGSNIQKKGE